MHVRWRLKSGLLVAALLVAEVLACQGGRPDITGSVGGGQQTGAGGSLAGVAIKGRIARAAVRVFRLEAGKRAAQVGTGQTGEDGAWSVDVGLSEGPFLVVVSGGSFVDEASGAAIQLNTDELTALVPEFKSGGKLEGVLVTPVSHFAAAQALYYVRANGKSVQEAYDAAWTNMNGHFGFGASFDWRTTIPVDATVSTSSQLDGPGRMGLLLAALSQEARTLSEELKLTPGGSVNALSLTEALYADISYDGLFDGVGGQGPIVLPSSGVLAPYRLTGDTARYELASALANWLSNPLNKYRATLADVQPLLRELSKSSSPALFSTAGRDFDSTPPSLSFVAHYVDASNQLQPAVGAERWVRGDVVLEVTATDASELKSLVVRGPGGAELRPALQGNTTHYFQGTWSTAGGPEGDITFTAEAVDAVENRSGVQTFTVRVDNTRPTLAPAGAEASRIYSRQAPVRASATDWAGSGLLSFGVVSGLAGFQNASATLGTVDGVFTIPEGTGDADLAYVLRACDLVGNCSEETRYVRVDQLPPMVAFTSTPSRYVNAAPVTVTLTAQDNRTAVSVVRVSLGNETKAATCDAGTCTASFTLPSEGEHIIYAWALDSAADLPNDGFATAKKSMQVMLDTTKPLMEAAIGDMRGQYRPERDVQVRETSAGSHVPASFPNPDLVGQDAAVRVDSGMDLYKVTTLLLRQQANDTSDQLDTTNPLNTPFLRWRVQKQVSGSPIESVRYAITCGGCATGSPSGGDLLLTQTLQQVEPTFDYYNLPLNRFTVPGLLTATSDSVLLNVTVTVKDMAGNATSLAAQVRMHLVAPPLIVWEDTDWVGRNDPQGVYAYRVGNLTYDDFFNASGEVRVARLRVRNPWPQPIAANATPAAGASTDWTFAETWNDDVAAVPGYSTRAVGTYTLDGFSYGYNEEFDDGTFQTICPANSVRLNPCGPGQSVIHSVGDAQQFRCIYNEALPGKRVRAGPTQVTQYGWRTLGYAYGSQDANEPSVSALPGGYTLAGSRAWRIPPAGDTASGEATLYLVVSRGRPSGAPPVTQTDFGGYKPLRIQYHEADLWDLTGMQTGVSTGYSNNCCKPDPSDPAPADCSLAWKSERAVDFLSGARFQMNTSYTVNTRMTLTGGDGSFPLVGAETTSQPRALVKDVDLTN